MTEYYVTYCINLDDRDADGKPKLIRNPKGSFHINTDDIVHLSFSIIEDGAERELGTAKLWDEVIKLKEERPYAR
jgi:hypothetical protein